MSEDPVRGLAGVVAKGILGRFTWQAGPGRSHAIPGSLRLPFYTRSITRAIPWPTPMHIVARP